MSRRSLRPLLLAALSLTAACRYSLEDPVEYAARSCGDGSSAACMNSVGQSNLKWLEQNIFPSCTFSGCHNGAQTDAGRLDLQEGKAHANLVDVDSEIATGPMLGGKAKLVVAGDPNKSYLLVMLRSVTPAEFDPPLDEPPRDVGYMPQNAGGVVMCCQKLDAIKQWILDGAQDN